MNNPNVFNPNWSLQDTIMFNKILIDEADIVCLWVENGTSCNDPIKAKDFKYHLHHQHGITSEYHPYQCLWPECFTPPMKRSSLERHMKEQHVPVKWACPFCTQTFTRESTIREHFGKVHGYT